MKMRSFFAAFALLLSLGTPPAWAQVADNAPRVAYVATASQTAFSYTFEILAQTDLKVLKNGTTLALSTHYTVSGVGNQNGGTVTLVTGATVGDEIVIYRDQAISRSTDYQPGARLNPDTLDLDFDRVILGLQQVERDVERTLRLAPSDVFSPLTDFVLPDSQARASKFLSFDTNGKPSVAAAVAINAEELAAVETIALLKAVSSAGLTDRDNIFVQGYYAAGDGGGGEFYWDATSSATANDGTVILPTGHSGNGRWVALGMEGVVNVKRFGAKGDGSTNDTTFIQAAIDAADDTGVPVEFPAATYIAVPATAATEGIYANTVAFAMRSNMHLVGRGATIKLKDSQSTDGTPKAVSLFYTATAISNVSFRGLTFDLNGANNKQSPSRPATYNRYFHAAIQVDSASGRIDDMVVEGNTFKNSAGSNCIVMGLMTTGGTLGKRWTVKDNLFLNNGTDTDDHSSVYGWADDVLIEGNTFSSDSAYRTTGLTGATTAYEVHGANHRFVGNTVRNYQRGLYVAENYTSATRGVVIDGNTFNPMQGYAVSVFRSSASSQAVSDVAITNNTINLDDSTYTDAPALRTAIDISPTYAVSDILIAGNVVEKISGTTYGSSLVALTVSSTAAQKNTNITVRGNTTRDVTVPIYISTNATNGVGTFVVADNTFFEPSDGGAFTPVGVATTFSGSATAIDLLTITGNTIVDLRGTPQADYGVNLAGTITTLDYRNNTIKGMAVATYSDASATITNRFGDHDGTFTPTRNSFTEVLGGGTITATGSYTKNGNIVNLAVLITCAGGATIAATSGAGSYISGLPFSVGHQASGTWVNTATIAESGGLFLQSANSNMYVTNGWAAAANNTYLLSATYRLTAP
jgi:hypothetical protein